MGKHNTLLIVGGAIAVGAVAFFLLRQDPSQIGAVSGIVTDVSTGLPISDVNITYVGPVSGYYSSNRHICFCFQ